MPRLAPEPLGPTLTLGEILVEIMAATPGEGFLSPQPLIGPFPSGAPAIFIDQCATFGGQAAMIGAVGADDFGRMVLDRLRRDGVDVTAVATDPDAATGSAFVRYRADGSRDFVFNLARSAAASLEWNSAVQAVVARAGHLHVMGSALAMPQAAALIDRAWPEIRARGGTLSVDPNLRKELLRDRDMQDRLAGLVDQADLLLPSGPELMLVAGVEEEAAALDRLFARGVKAVVLKRGSRGGDGDPAGRRPDRGAGLRGGRGRPDRRGRLFRRHAGGRAALGPALGPRAGLCRSRGGALRDPPRPDGGGRHAGRTGRLHGGGAGRGARLGLTGNTSFPRRPAIAACRSDGARRGRRWVHPDDPQPPPPATPSGAPDVARRIGAFANRAQAIGNLSFSSRPRLCFDVRKRGRGRSLSQPWCSLPP